MIRFFKKIIFILFLIFPLFLFGDNLDVANNAPSLNFSLSSTGNGTDFSLIIQILLVMTFITLAPSIVMLMTSFTRIVIVLGFVRNAVGVQQSPANQIIIGLAIFLSIFIMTPVWNNIYQNAYVPYDENKISSKEALVKASDSLKKFMLKQAKPNDIEFFLGLARRGPTKTQDLDLPIVLPAFVLSELRTAFQMGFMVFIPFIIIDFLVASTLMAMGMMMMPPVVISLPFKLLLFVLVDGWYLVIKSLVESFRT